jgi:hypothetical protein
MKTEMKPKEEKEDAIKFCLTVIWQLILLENGG